MSKKLIMLDIDGTLLNSKEEINENTKNALQKIIKDEKAIVCLATGRFINESVLDIANEIGLKHYVINVNGNFIYDIENKTNISIAKPLVQAVVNMFYDKAKQTKRQLIAYNTDQECRRYYFGTTEQKDVCDHDYFCNGIKVKSFDELSGVEFFLNNKQKPIVHISLKAEKDLINKHFYELYNLQLTNLAKISHVSKVFIDADPIDISKWNAIKIVAQKLNVDLNNIICFGDSFNDLEMIKNAGHGFLLSNASDEMKKQVKPEQIIGNNDSTAIADKLNELLYH